MRKNAEAHKEFQRMWRRNKNIVFRDKAFELLGGNCVRCGQTDREVLEIDHEHCENRTNRLTGSGLKEAIVRGQVALKGLQLLCANCHRKKTTEDRKKFGSWKELKKLREDYPHG